MQELAGTTGIGGGWARSRAASANSSGAVAKAKVPRKLRTGRGVGVRGIGSEYGLAVLRMRAAARVAQDPFDRRARHIGDAAPLEARDRQVDQLRGLANAGMERRERMQNVGLRDHASSLGCHKPGTK